MDLIQVENLQKKFKVNRGAMGKKATITAVKDVSFTIEEGMTLGLVGESGCGKSTIAKLLIKLLEPTSGTINYEGRDVTFLKERHFKRLRRNIQIVFQDPFSSLNTRMSIYKTLSRPLKIFKFSDSKEKEREMIRSILAEVGLKPEHMNRYPHEFSGGQRQRIAIARAMITSPRFVVLDEPTSALDVSVQAQIMNLLLRLKEELKLTYLFISHDLSVVKFISDAIAVMYLGSILEMAETQALFDKRYHPYTQLLLSSIPEPDPDKKMDNLIDTGELPSQYSPPKGCPFVTRCPRRMERCEREMPPFYDMGNGHKVACFLYEKTG